METVVPEQKTTPYPPANRWQGHTRSLLESSRTAFHHPQNWPMEVLLPGDEGDRLSFWLRQHTFRTKTIFLKTGCLSTNNFHHQNPDTCPVSSRLSCKDMMTGVREHRGQFAAESRRGADTSPVPDDPLGRPRSSTVAFGRENVKNLVCNRVPPE